MAYFNIKDEQVDITINRMGHAAPAGAWDDTVHVELRKGAELLNKALPDVAPLSKNIRYKWSTKMTACAGRAHCSDRYIQLSLPLWERATKEQRRETILHELCHLYDFSDGCKKGRHFIAHGRSWKRLMRVCGLPGKRCHSISTRGLGKKTVPVYCPCSTRYMSPYKAGRIPEGLWTCGKCGSTLRLTPYSNTAAAINDRLLKKAGCMPKPQPKRVAHKTSNEDLMLQLLQEGKSTAFIQEVFDAVYAGKNKTQDWIAKRIATYKKIAQKRLQ